MNSTMKILLVEDDNNTCSRFISYMNERNDMVLSGVTNNANTAIRITKEFYPDAIILDLELNEGVGNGLTYLSELKEMSPAYTPYVVVTTNNSSNTTYSLARKLGADFIMFKHQKDYSERSVIEFLAMIKDSVQASKEGGACGDFASQLADSSHKQIEKAIYTELNLIGVNTRTMGYLYLTEAIMMIIDGETTTITKKIAKKYQKTDASVERAMQHAINTAWRASGIDDLGEHYTAHIRSEKGVPTIMELVHFYAKKIKNYL